MITVGLGGARRHGSVALLDASRIVGVCEQERVTRVRNAGFNPTGLPDESLDLLLQRQGRRRQDVDRYVLAGDEAPDGGLLSVERVDHHRAHAATAYLTSPFSSAAIVICDDERPKVSLWEGRGPTIERLDLQWTGPGFADLYSSCARPFGFHTGAGGQRFEALARLCPDGDDDRVGPLFTMKGVNELALDPNGSRILADLVSADAVAGPSSKARMAAAVQKRIGAVLLEFLQLVRHRTSCDQLCLAGDFFYHSSMNTLAKRSGPFKSVFVPVDPGDGGLAVGAALHVDGGSPRVLTPFLGPSYAASETKEVLDNCKLQYSWESEETVRAIAVDALLKGQLVGWFDGAMEWGPRALGARCILASPFMPFVLENLNRFLKRRELWRGYAISALAESVAEHFDGPDAAPYMECDYRPRDATRFAHALPAPAAAIRVHTVTPDAPTRFRDLLDACGASSGIPMVMNTSFNGLNEPIVCNPRDAVRVFYGSGLDLLIIDRFVLRK